MLIFFFTFLQNKQTFPLGRERKTGLGDTRLKTSSAKLVVQHLKEDIFAVTHAETGLVRNTLEFCYQSPAKIREHFIVPLTEGGFLDKSGKAEISSLDLQIHYQITAVSVAFDRRDYIDGGTYDLGFPCCLLDVAFGEKAIPDNILKERIVDILGTAGRDDPETLIGKKDRILEYQARCFNNVRDPLAGEQSTAQTGAALIDPRVIHKVFTADMKYFINIQSPVRARIIRDRVDTEYQ
ncbi:MAG: hypothetical protein IKO00_15605, partial [Oscillospiraceae bacterium]|nr:hypothetical protein [Oscillospiraceae bacterium]